MIKKSSIAKKLSNHDFYIKIITRFKELGDSIEKLAIKCHNQRYYDRKEGRGWWMVIKETCILHYIEMYLQILRAQNKQRHLIYIDLLSSCGMVKLTDEEFHDDLKLPGSSLLAAYQNFEIKNRFFNQIIANSMDSEDRAALIERIECFNDALELDQKINFIVPNPNDGRIDSNNFINTIIEEISNAKEIIHYLAIVDNEGLDIKYDTLKKLRLAKNGQYGDVIINYPNSAINRIWGNKRWDSLKEFFGIDVKDIDKNQYLELYKNQLGKIGLFKIREVEVSSGESPPFFYTLLFCVRKLKSGAPWLDMIENFKEKRFKNFGGKQQKELWKIFRGHQSSLNSFLN